MGFTTLSSQSPVDGSVAIPVAAGRYGMDDQLRQQEAVVVGKAYSYMDSDDPADRKSIYLFGNALARPELGGVIAQDGNAPTMVIAAATGDADTTTGIFAGYAPVLLAPGEVITSRGQHLEPIPTGTYQAMWRVSESGPAIARQAFDNSGGTAGALVSADLFLCCEQPPESVSAVGPSSDLMGVTVETAYDVTRTIAKNSLRVGDRLRFVSIVKAGNGAAGANTVKGYINGIGSGVLFTAPATTFSANDTVVSFIDAYVASIGASGSLSLAGQLTTGTIGTATARASASSLTIDTTVDNVVTIANTPNNIADTSSLLFLSVERL